MIHRTKKHKGVFSLNVREKFVREVVEPFTKNRKLARKIAEALIKHEICFNDTVKKRVRSAVADLINVFPWGETSKERIIAEEPQDEVTRDILVHRMAPFLERARRKILGRSAPFTILNEYEQWEKDLVEGRIKVDRPPRESLELRTDDFSSEEIVIRVRGKRLPNGTQQLKPLPDPLQEFIRREIRILSNLSGWHYSRTLYYVLFGEVPKFPALLGVPEAPRYRLRVFPNNDVGISRARLDIYAKDLSYKEMGEIYRRLRKELNVRGRKALNKTDLALYKLVEEEKQKGARWKNILKKWNEKHNEREFNTVRGVQMAYRRILERLGIPTIERERREQVIATMRNLKKKGNAEG